MDSSNLFSSDMSTTTETSLATLNETSDSQSSPAQESNLECENVNVHEQDPDNTCLPTFSQHMDIDNDIGHPSNNLIPQPLNSSDRSSKELSSSCQSSHQIHPSPQLQDQEQQQQHEEDREKKEISPARSQHIQIDEAGPSTLAQLLAPQTVAEPSSADLRSDSAPISSLLSTNNQMSSSRAPPPPQLSLSPTPLFTSADEPPPYSPTHTILPHYFSLEPIPIRSYIIQDSASIPFLYDFWLCTTPQSVSPGLLFQQRGLSQTSNQLKYCIIRPQHTDRTAFPPSGSSGQDAYFIPALALVAANYPSRWIWWGTEALQMVVFGRQLKNIIMEWKWKHGRLRIGGPIVHRLIGCSFQITPERKYCWKQGSGRKRNQNMTGARQSRNNQRPNGNSNNNNRRGDQSISPTSPLPSEVHTRAAGGSWVGSFFSRPTSNQGSTNTSRISTNDVPMNHISVTIPPTQSSEPSNSSEPAALSAVGDNVPLSEQEAIIDLREDEDEETGCYHCREENSIGVTGRIVAVYRPGRPANRARDRPASSPKLEIFTELGERCETVMMLMCVRLDDLFMSIPDEKKGPFVSPGGRGQDGSPNDSNPQHGNDVEGTTITTGENGTEGGAVIDGDNQSELSAFKRILGSHGVRILWLKWSKWLAAAILIAMVIVLVLKSRSSHPS
ncbi:hypothetical protein BGZ46_008340 [Entomortierella lignicola]|nr:hypothetical protein BGZ46_008340 [Entomortierella lignicola]